MPLRTVFHLSAWLRALSKSFSARIITCRAFENDQLVAVWPVLESRKGPFRLLGSPLPGWSTPYLGPLFAIDCDQKATLRALLLDSHIRSSAFFSCRTREPNIEIADGTSDFPAPHVDLSDFGFRLSGWLDTYLINLCESEQELWSNLKSQCRSKINKARRSGIDVRNEKRGEFLNEFWQMSIETFSKSGLRPTYTQAFCKAVVDELYAADQIIVMSGFVDGQRAATILLPYDDQTMYYWAGAAFQRFRHIPIHNLLLWEAIRHARSMSLQFFDLVTTGGGAGEFKKSFGPKRMLTGARWERSASSLISAAKSAYQLALRWRRRI